MSKKDASFNNKVLTIKRLLKTNGSNKVILIVSFICAIFSSILAIVIPYIAGKAIDLLVGINNVDFKLLIRYIVLMVCLTAIVAIVQNLMYRINCKISYDITKQVRNMAYQKINSLPVSYFDKNDSGVRSMIISDCETIGDGLLLCFNQFFTGIVTIIATLLIMFNTDFYSASFVLIFTPVSMICAFFIASKSFKYFKMQSKSRSEQTTLIGEMTSNPELIHAYGYEDKAISRFSEKNEEFRKISKRATFLSSLTNPTTRFINSLIYAGVAFLGAARAISGSLSIGELTCLLAYATQFMKPFNEISGVYTEISDALACADRVFEYLDTDELPPDFVSGAFNDSCAKGNIVFDNVSFSYVKGRPILKNVSLNIPAGKTVAIVGPTGCGKTTLINLFMHFYEPDSGKILLDGNDISSIGRKELRSQVGMVPQDTWFRNSSVLENLKYGRPEATEDEVISCARDTGAHDFVKRLPHRYDEVISSSSEGISEGQKQLLSITRCMVSKPSVIILDEATSSIDTLSEVKIQNSIVQLCEGRTAIIIAHRLSTITSADIIVVMKDGNVIEQGSHKELLAKNGFYSRLYESYNCDTQTE